MIISRVLVDIYSPRPTRNIKFAEGALLPDSVQEMSHLVRSHRDLGTIRILITIADPDVAFLTFDIVQVACERAFSRRPQ